MPRKRPTSTVETSIPPQTAKYTASFIALLLKEGILDPSQIKLKFRDRRPQNEALNSTEPAEIDAGNNEKLKSRQKIGNFRIIETIPIGSKSTNEFAVGHEIDFIVDDILHSDKEKLLSLLFEAEAVPQAQRPDLERAIKALIADSRSDHPMLARGIAEQADTTKGKSWKERVGRPSSVPLPETAPALWADEKQPGDTPPTFIKRHYSEYLRPVGGLTRPDIKRLDPQLYTALANWLRKNELPEDCPLPTKSEALSQADVTPRPPVSDEETRAYWRAASRESYARRDNKILK